MKLSLARARRLLFALLCCACFAHSRALADEPTASANEVSLARREFLAGVARAGDNDWAGALAAFEHSYAVYPHPETLINIAGARRRLGKLVAASEAYQGYLRTSDVRRERANRRLAEAALRELAADIAQVVLVVRGLETADLVMLDGGALGRGTLGLELPIDPGEHVLVVLRDQNEIARRSFVATRASRSEVVLDVAPSARLALTNPSPLERAAQPARGPLHAPEREPGRPLRRKWWVWTSVGVVVAGAVAAGLLWRPREARAYEGDHNAKL